MNDTPDSDEASKEDVLVLASEIVAAYAGRNQMASAELPDLIRTVHATLAGLAGGVGADHEVEAVQVQAAPAVPIDAS
ncbi:MAG: MucR family transcriptional regulator, partial [Parasphingorhabdus sp.]